MVVPFIFLGICLSSRVTATILFTVPSTAVVGQPFAVTWTAGISDPDNFTAVIANTFDTVGFTQNLVVARGGQRTGQSTVTISHPGTYYVGAEFDDEIPFSNLSKGIQVQDAVDIGTQVSSQSSNTQTPSVLSRTTTAGLGISNTATSTSGPVLESRPLSSHSTESSNTPNAPTSQGMTTTNSLFLSTVTSDPGSPSTSIPSSSTPLSATVSHKPSEKVPIMLGSIFGVIALLAATTTLLVVQRRHRISENIPVSPYEPSMAENTRARSRLPLRVFISRKRHLNTVNVEAEVSANDVPIRSEKSETQPEQVAPPEWQTSRQQSLQAQAIEMERQLSDSEAALHSIPNASPEFTWALVSENIRLQAEIEQLRDLNRSDWALGLTHVPPPSYPHSEASSP
ncbi:hypothetical protein C8J56DRAFT_946029 [Mycena floridula]|nr:hypothetical protein C8J56DRAFT_946029 [Mycena floridula]